MRLFDREAVSQFTMDATVNRLKELSARIASGKDVEEFFVDLERALDVIHTSGIIDGLNGLTYERLSSTFKGLEAVVSAYKEWPNEAESLKKLVQRAGSIGGKMTDEDVNKILSSSRVFLEQDLRFDDRIGAPVMRRTVTRFIDDIIHELSLYAIKDGVEVKPKKLKSIHLIGDTIDPRREIALVLDEDFEHPVRSAALHHGQETTIKKLYNIVYVSNDRARDVPYTRKLMNGINTGLFRRPRVEAYLRTNGIEKPTLVRKVNGLLELTGEVLVKTIRPAEVPSQFRYLYKKEED